MKQTINQLIKNIDCNTSKMIKFCKNNNETLTKKENDFRTNYIPKTSIFYGQPKIYKSKKIKKKAVETQKSEYIEIPDSSDLKFRPIPAGPSFPTNRLRKLVDFLL